MFANLIMASTITSGIKPPQVVIAFLDGRRLRGYVFDFSPAKESCRIFPKPQATQGEGEVVTLLGLKALFFLREDAEAALFASRPATVSQRRKIEVLFRDNEKLEGTTEGYSKERPGFFMVPDDPTGKIIRVFVVNANVKEVKWVQAPHAPAAP
jgi:hypothetical protein